MYFIIIIIIIIIYLDVIRYCTRSYSIWLEVFCFLIGVL